MVHPFSRDWYVGGSILVSGRSSSIVEIERFQLQRFTVSVKELAEWFGLEVARLVVDECPAQRENWVAKYLCRSCPRCDGYLGIVVPERKIKMLVQAIKGTVPEMWLSACVGSGSKTFQAR